MRCASLGHFLQDIPFSTFPRASGHRVGALGIWPKTETVVVFRNYDHSLESSRLRDGCPLVAVQVRWVENILSLRPETPFHPSESVWAETDQEIHLHLLPFHLLGSGERAIRLRWGDPAASCYRNSGGAC